MAFTFDYLNKIISVPQADLTFVSGTFYTMDTNWFKNQLLAEMGSENGIWADDMYVHNTQVGPIAGTTFARTIQIVNGWKVQFTPDSQWTVQLEGSNNDIWSVGDGILVQNQVQVIPTNSGGLVVGGSGSGASAADVWNYVGSSAVNKEDDLIKARKAAESAFAVSA